MLTLAISPAKSRKLLLADSGLSLLPVVDTCAAVYLFTQPLGDSLCSLGDDREKNVCVIETGEFLFLVLISKQQYDIVKIICFS